MKSSSHSGTYRSLAWPVAWVMLVCLLYGGFVRAQHTHGLDANDEHAQHLECLLCVDANHPAVPPALVHAPVFQLAWFIIVAPLVLGAHPLGTRLFYDARGPPRV